MAIYQDSIRVNHPLLLISGQIPLQDDYIPNPIEEQLNIVINKIDAIIKTNSTKKENVVKMNVYITDRAYLTVVREQISNYLGEIKPAMTLVIVAGLINPDFKVEIDATVLITE